MISIPMWVLYLLAISGFCNVIACLTPTNHKLPVVQGILDIVNVLALNIRRAENKDETRL